MFLNENKLAQWVESKNGVLLTRSIANVNNYNFTTINDVVFSCITGYQEVIRYFFDKIIHYLKYGTILIIIESDEIKLKKDQINHINLLHCFSWNIPFVHYKISPLPIGLNFHRQHNVIVNWMQSKKKKKPNKLLCFNGTLTDDSRRNIIDKAKTTWKSFCNVLPQIAFLDQYVIPSYIEGRIMISVTDPKCYEQWQDFKFILSPRGAGIDCHRTWETLIVGRIPVVLSSLLDSLFQNLPVLILKSWDDLSQRLLNDFYDEYLKKIENKEYKFEKLNLDYWVQEIEKTKKLKRPQIHFITYGNNVFEKAKKRIVKEANRFAEFSSVSALGPENLPKDFQEKFANILKIPRIAGCGIWRPKIILDKLETMKNGDFLLYLDAGCSLNAYAKKRFYEYLHLFTNNKMGIMTIQMTGNKFGSLCRENQYTRKEIFDYFNIDPNSEIGNSAQCLSGVLLMRKNDHLMKIINLWLNAVYCNVSMFTDLELGKQHDGFISNRHEQSVLSILTKIHKSIVINGDESWTIPFGGKISLNYPFWATRKRD